MSDEQLLKTSPCPLGLNETKPEALIQTAEARVGATSENHPHVAAQCWSPNSTRRLEPSFSSLVNSL